MNGPDDDGNVDLSIFRVRDDEVGDMKCTVRADDDGNVDLSIFRSFLYSVCVVLTSSHLL